MSLDRAITQSSAINRHYAERADCPRCGAGRLEPCKPPGWVGELGYHSERYRRAVDLEMAGDLPRRTEGSTA